MKHLDSDPTFDGSSPRESHTLLRRRNNVQIFWRIRGETCLECGHWGQADVDGSPLSFCIIDVWCGAFQDQGILGTRIKMSYNVELSWKQKNGNTRNEINQDKTSRYKQNISNQAFRKFIQGWITTTVGLIVKAVKLNIYILQPTRIKVCLMLATRRATQSYSKPMPPFWLHHIVLIENFNFRGWFRSKRG